MAGRQGFEPRYAAPEAAVLPLDDLPTGLHFIMRVRLIPGIAWHNGKFMSRIIERALLSVTNKTGIVDFARSLSSLGVEIVSTGGTHRVLREAGTASLREVAEVT